MTFVPVDGYAGGIVLLLYNLLSQRTPEQSISHTAMPTFAEHTKFVRSHPYSYWYVIKVDRAFVGAIYLTVDQEIGLGILREHQRRGYGREAVLTLMEMYPGPFLANINPNNDASIAFWKALGFTLKQVTYAK